MPEIISITLPKLGESITSATVVSWLKNVGDKVAIDEPLLEVATDKVNSEIPSPVAGVLKEICANINEVVEVGGVLANIEAGASLGESSDKEMPFQVKDKPPCPLSSSAGQKGNAELFSPAVLRLAQMEGIPLEVICKMQGTGKEGRVSKKDIEEFIKKRGNSQESEKIFTSTLEERIELSGMRKAIAENMVRSFYEAPHASLVQEVDVTEILALIALKKEEFFKNHGAKLTITSFVAFALAQTLQNFPMINASLEEKTIVMKRYVNVGIAVNIPGGLIVPVIKQCQEKNLQNIAKAVGDLAQKAREGKLAPDDVAEGTITLSNFGMTGALIGIPIIRFPEVAIIGAGTIQKRVAVREDNSLAIRQMVYLTLTFDHRVIDGIYGCEFLKSLKDCLESFNIDNL